MSDTLVQAGALTQIIYRSTVVGDPSELDMHQILVTARVFNADQKISGMLLYRDRTFVQLLEGPEAAVTKLYERIKVDSRHTDVSTLVSEPIAERRFARWAMSFRVIERFGSLPLRGLSPALDHRYVDLAALDPSGANALFTDLASAA